MLLRSWLVNCNDSIGASLKTRWAESARWTVGGVSQLVGVSRNAISRLSWSFLVLKMLVFFLRQSFKNAARPVKRSNKSLHNIWTLNNFSIPDKTSKKNSSTRGSKLEHGNVVALSLRYKLVSLLSWPLTSGVSAVVFSCLNFKTRLLVPPPLYSDAAQSVLSPHWLCMQSRGWWSRPSSPIRISAPSSRPTKGTITAASRRLCFFPTCYANTLILPFHRLPTGIYYRICVGILLTFSGEMITFIFSSARRVAPGRSRVERCIFCQANESLLPLIALYASVSIRGSPLVIADMLLKMCITITSLFIAIWTMTVTNRRKRRLFTIKLQCFLFWRFTFQSRL